MQNKIDNPKHSSQRPVIGTYAMKPKLDARGAPVKLADGKTKMVRLWPGRDVSKYNPIVEDQKRGGRS